MSRGSPARLCWADVGGSYGESAHWSPTRRRPPGEEVEGSEFPFPEAIWWRRLGRFGRVGVDQLEGGETGHASTLQEAEASRSPLDDGREAGMESGHTQTTPTTHWST